MESLIHGTTFLALSTAPSSKSNITGQVVCQCRSQHAVVNVKATNTTIERVISQSLRLRGAGNVDEIRLISQVGRVREVVCA